VQDFGKGKGPLGIPRRRREDNIKNESARSMMERGMDCCGL